MKTRCTNRLRIIAMTILVIVLCVIGYCLANRWNPPEEEWHLEYIGAEALHKVRAEKITVAVIDSKIDRETKELRSLIWTNLDEVPANGKDDDNNGYVDDVHGYDFVADREAGTGVKSHGTTVASIIASDNKRSSYYGVAAPRNIKILPVGVFSEKDSKKEDVVLAIEYAELSGSTVCNICINISSYSKELDEAIKTSKMLFVVSAGNATGAARNLKNKPTWPACLNYDNVITVANLKSNGRLNTKSCYGPEYVDIAAPGTGIYVPLEASEYGYTSGTSLAAPMVTALAATMYSLQPDLTASECKRIILESADKSDQLKSRVNDGNVINCRHAIEIVSNFQACK